MRNAVLSAVVVSLLAAGAAQAADTSNGGPIRADSDEGGHLFQSHRGQAGIVSKVGFGHVIAVLAGSSVKAQFASMPLKNSRR